MIKVKICGLTVPEEAAYLNQNKVDFAGMVLFFSKSKRNISIERAKEIMAALDRHIKTIAVVVSPDLEAVRAIEDAGFDMIQIHGTVSDTVLEHVCIPVIKAFNVSDIDQYAHFRKIDKVIGYVFDAEQPGSGKTFDWSSVQQLPRDEKFFLIGGGLNPYNVSEAVRVLNPDGVDVSSGVEYVDRPGKDPEQIRKFVENARGEAGCR